MKKKRTLSTILLILLIIAFLASGGYLFHYFWMAKQTENELSQLQQIRQEAFFFGHRRRNRSEIRNRTVDSKGIP